MPANCAMVSGVMELEERRLPLRGDDSLAGVRYCMRGEWLECWELGDCGEAAWLALNDERVLEPPGADDRPHDGEGAERRWDGSTGTLVVLLRRTGYMS